jgi:hypothetical protein
MFSAQSAMTVEFAISRVQPIGHPMVHWASYSSLKQWIASLLHVSSQQAAEVLQHIRIGWV